MPQQQSVLWDAQTGRLIRYADTGYACSLRWSPEKTFIAAGGYDSTVTVCSTRTGRALRTFTGHTAAVTAVCWVGETRLFSGDQDGNLLLWDTSASDPTQWKSLPLPHTMIPMQVGIDALTCSPDSTKLATLYSNDMLDTFSLM